jgi:hypothetical protein
MSRLPQGTTQVKTPKTRELETQSKIRRIRARLDEIAEYKKVLAADGSKPDGDDKRLESELIVRLLYLEKELKNMAPEALALKARAREEEAVRGAQVEAQAMLKRRGKGDARRVSVAPMVASDEGANPLRSEGSSDRKPAPRREPWRSPYEAGTSESKPVSPRREGRGKATATRSPRDDRRPSSTSRPDAKKSAPRGDKRPSPYASCPDAKKSAPRGDKRPSPYASRPDAKKSAPRGDNRPSSYASRPDAKKSAPRGDKRPSPYAARPDAKTRAKSGDEPVTSSAKAAKKKGYWSREDRRVRPSQPGRRPAKSV